MPTVGDGVYELRIRAEGAFRVCYVTKRAEGIVVLHAFQKKTQQPAQLDLDPRSEAIPAVPRRSAARLRRYDGDQDAARQRQRVC